MSPDCTICYVSDLNFLLPSLISAAGVRRFVPPNRADIYIFTVNVDSSLASTANPMLESHGIRIVPIDKQAFSALDQEKLARTLTPLGTFGRFFMEAYLPPSCRRIVYLDGDTLPIRDVSALIDVEIPKGRFAAAEDTIYYRQNLNLGKTTKSIRDYFKQLGLKHKNGYFNAGVFAVERNTWKKISEEAYNYFLHNTEACKHFDQSALNAVVGDRRLRLSATWNFQTQMKIWGVDRYISPNIIHLTRYPKPWMGICEPWPDLYAHYQEEKGIFSPLDIHLTTLEDKDVAAYNLATRKTYSYLQLPLVTPLVLRLIDFFPIEKSAWM